MSRKTRDPPNSHALLGKQAIWSGDVFRMVACGLPGRVCQACSSRNHGKPLACDIWGADHYIPPCKPLGRKFLPNLLGAASGKHLSPTFHVFCWATFYILAHCGLVVEPPHLTAENIYIYIYIYIYYILYIYIYILYIYIYKCLLPKPTVNQEIAP